MSVITGNYCKFIMKNMWDAFYKEKIRISFLIVLDFHLSFDNIGFVLTMEK